MSDPTEAAPTFDPTRYLVDIGDKKYLPVQARVLWLRTVHPDAQISTELVSRTETNALFRAHVSIPGGGSATGYGSEEKTDFRDFIEKSETKSLGRALAALGFGTQFCTDFEFGEENQCMVDSPVSRGNVSRYQDSGQRPQASPNKPATPKQIKFLESIAKEQGVSAADLGRVCEHFYGKPLAQLSAADCSKLIARLQDNEARPLAEVVADLDRGASPAAQPSVAAVATPAHGKLVMDDETKGKWLASINKTTSLAQLQIIHETLITNFATLPADLSKALDERLTHVK